MINFICLCEEFILNRNSKKAILKGICFAFIFYFFVHCQSVNSIAVSKASMNASSASIDLDKNKVGVTSLKNATSFAYNEDTPLEKSPPLLFMPLDALLKEHIKTGTHIDGPRCPMYPSCSAWARRAIRKHGYDGFLMLIDRLIYRESGNLYEKYLHAPKKFSKDTRFYDPVEENLPIFKPHHPSFLKEDFPEMVIPEKEFNK